MNKGKGLTHARETDQGELSGLLAKSAKRNEYSVLRRKRLNNSSAFALTWDEQMREAFPDATRYAWTVDRLKMMGEIACSLAVHVDPHAFVTFVIKSWADILVSKFSTMRSRPSFPKLAFIKACHDGFSEAYSEFNKTGFITPPASAKPAIEAPSAAIKRELAETQQRLAHIEAELRAERRKPKTATVVVQSVKPKPISLKKPLVLHKSGDLPDWED